MAIKLTRLTHKVAIQLYLVAESCTICSSRSRQPVRKLLVTPSYEADETDGIFRNTVDYLKCTYFQIGCRSVHRIFRKQTVTATQVSKNLRS
jgi:hypothetical protein